MRGTCPGMFLFSLAWQQPSPQRRGWYRPRDFLHCFSQVSRIVGGLWTVPEWLHGHEPLLWHFFILCLRAWPLVRMLHFFRECFRLLWCYTQCLAPCCDLLPNVMFLCSNPTVTYQSLLVGCFSNCEIELTVSQDKRSDPNEIIFRKGFLKIKALFQCYLS